MYYLCLDRASLIATSYIGRTVLKVLESLLYSKWSQVQLESIGVASCFVSFLVSLFPFRVL